MKLSDFKISAFILFMVILFTSLSYESKAQTPFTNTGKAKYVKTAVDTFSIPGVSGAYRQGFITNQSSTTSLNVMFSKRDGSKDTSSRVIIPAGKTLHFNFVGTKIYRYTSADSAYSQVIVGDVQLNFNELEFKDEYELVNQSENFMAYFKENVWEYDNGQYVGNKAYKREKIYAAAAILCNPKIVFGSGYFWGS